MKTFETLNLSPIAQKAIAALNFTVPTPIQIQAIPLALTGKDIIGCAQTGTGKTTAFCVPVLENLLANPEKKALILVPTRELAVQVEDFWRKLTAQIPKMSSIVIIGGAAMYPQIKSLSRQPRMIIATPGRLMDHLQRKTVKLSDIHCLVLDEADRMLDMGFAPQLNEILKHIPKNRQTLFFTATWESSLEQLAKKYVQNPEKITVESSPQSKAQIQQRLVATPSGKKNESLLDTVNTCKGSILIFARTQLRTDGVARYLATYGLHANRLHGGRSQAQRSSALKMFRDGQVRILVATDIAARGIDVQHIGHVVNYDLPQFCDDYIHRIGRTGRAGAVGEAISLIGPEDRSQWRRIAQFLKKSGINTPQLSTEDAKINPAGLPKRVEVPQDFKPRESQPREFKKRFSGERNSSFNRSEGKPRFSSGFAKRSEGNSERSFDRNPERSFDRNSERSFDRRPERSNSEIKPRGFSSGFAKRSEGSSERSPERSFDRRPERSNSEIKPKGFVKSFAKSSERTSEKSRSEIKPKGFAKSFDRTNEAKTKKPFRRDFQQKY
jgi:ATP-dependent RNA helicase RhlE